MLGSLLTAEACSEADNEVGDLFSEAVEPEQRPKRVRRKTGAVHQGGLWRYGDTCWTLDWTSMFVQQGQGHIWSPTLDPTTPQGCSHHGQRPAWCTHLWHFCPGATWVYASWSECSLSSWPEAWGPGGQETSETHPRLPRHGNHQRPLLPPTHTRTHTPVTFDL